MPPEELILLLVSAARPLMVGHINPDIDALGAMLALARAMPATDPSIALPGEPPRSQKLRYLLDLGGDAAAIADPPRMASADLVVTLDAATPKRCNLEGGWDAIADKPVANIDHHITNSDYGRVNWVVDNASSTCELVHRLIVQAGWSLDASTATLLYAGIYADTAAFSLPNVRPETFDAAAELLRHGADIETVGARITRSHEPHEFDLVRRVYHNTHVACGGRIAYSSVSCQELHEIGCTPADIDDQVSIPRSLSGIRIAILFSEGEPGVIRINLRGENGTPVLNLAESLGGGGHLCSAGVRMRGELGEVIARVVSEAGEYLGRLDSTR